MDETKPPANIPELIFELGRLQVFHYPTLDDIANNLNPTDVYWQDKVSKHTYGPFTSVYMAMMHYSWLAAESSKKIGELEGKAAEIIHVDVIKKKRITYSVP